MINLPIILQVYKMFTKETVYRFHSVKCLLHLWILFYLINTMCNETSVKKIIINCDSLVESVWKLHTLFQEFQSVYFGQNFSESHRIQKSTMLVFQKIILKSVNWSLLIMRYIPSNKNITKKKIDKYKYVLKTSINKVNIQ